jgi:hypothetical protein
MSARPTVQMLSGGRLHLHHGPIDVIARAWGTPAAVRTAYGAAIHRFETVLEELVAELVTLRQPVSRGPCVASPVARRMVAACEPLADVFLTPMAAVAGAVADELASVMAGTASLDRLYVNDGGDIALSLSAGGRMVLGIAGDLAAGAAIDGRIEIAADSGVGGVATSGWRGRSFSLGIADAVTVLAASGAAADAAATLIANAVDVDSPAVVRRPACELDPDSDLGDRQVTTAVGGLEPGEIADALDAGARFAEGLRRRGLIVAAALQLGGAHRIVGDLARLEEEVA